MKFSDLSSKTQSLLVVIVLVIIIALGLIGYGIYSAYSFFNRAMSYQEKPVPKEIEKTGILKGKEFLEKKEIFKKKKLSNWEFLSRNFDDRSEKEKQKIISSHSAKVVFGFDDLKICGREIVAVGKFGAYYFDKNGKLKDEVLFEPIPIEIEVLGFSKTAYRMSLGDLRIFDLENDGTCEFISENSIDGLIVYNSQGKIIWRFGRNEVYFENERNGKKSNKEEIHVTGVALADINDDGKLEFIISRKNDGIRVFDTDKKEIWFQPSEFPTADFKYLDLDGDGSKDLFNFRGASSQIWDKRTGEIIKKIKLDGGKDGLLQVKDKNNKINTLTYEIYEGRLILSDLKNKVFWKAEVPLSEVKIKINTSPMETPTPIKTKDGETLIARPVRMSKAPTHSVYEPKAVLVKLKENKPEYLAIVGAFIGIPRANFYVYTLDGKLVYHELLPEDAETIAVLPNDKETEDILIGGKDTIWRFSAK